MRKILQGVHHFQSEVFETERELFERLSRGQDPETLFITCSDSRVVPSLVTQSRPGDLFVLRNAGNFVPAFGTGGGEAATVEYAVAVLHVTDLIVCGHSDCGAVKALLSPPEELADLSEVSAWLAMAEPTRRIVARLRDSLEGEALVRAAVEENVLVQVDNLRTHPSVAEGLRHGRLHLHAWTYDIGTGQVRAFDSEAQGFRPLNPSAEVAPR